MALRLIIAGLLAGAAVSAGAVVFTTDYNQLTVLPALTGNPGDQDWRTKGAVLPVRNEGQCDASWAFAAAELVGADYFIRKGQLFSLSTQELVDCTDGGSSCFGGSPVRALETVVARGGLAATATYPYTARVGTCRTSTAVATIPGAGRVPSGDEVSLQNYVARGPVLALVDASVAFDSYKAGIFTGPCSNTAPPTRAVFIVGYTTGGASGGYWIVKNSLGTTWGSQGYIFMARGQNLCGIANFAIAVSSDPLPAPAAVTPVPTLSTWAAGLFLLGLAATGLLALRR